MRIVTRPREFSGDAMRTIERFRRLALILALASLVMPAASRTAQPPLAAPQSSSNDPQQIDSRGKPPSDQEIRDRAEKFVANQHRDDEALEQYERVEHHVDRGRIESDLLLGFSEGGGRGPAPGVRDPGGA